MADHLTKGMFGDTDAAYDMVAALNKADARKLSRKMLRHWHFYLQGLSDLMSVPGTTQKEMMIMWRHRFIETGRKQFGAEMEAIGIPYTFYINIISYRFRKALEHGGLYQKLNS